MNDLVVKMLAPEPISGNFDEIKAQLSAMMEAYAELEVTEENLKERKADVATLRKIRAAIEDKRKSVKKEYEKPVKAFEAECKKLTGIIDEQIIRINDDLSVYEQKRISEKRERVAALYAEVIGEYAEYLPLEDIRQKQWDNKSCSENEIKSDIQQMRLTVEKDINVINQTCGEFAEICLNAYKSNGNQLSVALDRLQDMKKAKEIVTIESTSPVIEITKEPEFKLANKQYTFTVFNEQDANSVRSYLEMFDIEYKEE